MPRARAPRHRSRAVLAAAVAVATFALLVGTLGLHTSAPLGVADNFDGSRLSCTAGLTPDTPDRSAAWRGVVVTAFRVDGAPCVGPPMPLSSAEILLRSAVAVSGSGGPDGLWSLRWLGVLASGLVALGAGVAAAAASATSLRRAAVVALPLLPLVAVPWWSRFLVSTYSEPAGLLGTVWLLLGASVVAVTAPQQRRPRLAALALVVLGGVTAGTAKPGFLPVAAVAALLAAVVVVRGRTRHGAERGPGRGAGRAAGPAAAVLVLALVATPAAAALAWQREAYATINAHNLVFTGVLPVVGPQATGPLGLPPEAARFSGESWYLNRGVGVPGWTPTLGERPAAVRAAALELLARRPADAATLLDRGLQATMRPQLPYLTSAARGTVPDFSEPPTLHLDSPLDTLLLLDYLDDVPGRWLPGAVAVAALLGALTTVVPRVRRWIGAPATGLARAAAAAAATGVGIVGLAVAGDGLYELTKHVWLASYALLVAGLLLAAAVTAAVITAVTAPPRTAAGARRRGPDVSPGRDARSPSTPAPPRTAAGTGR